MKITKINVNGITYDIGSSSGSGGGGGGTTDYNALQNQPQINGVTLSGNKTTSDLLIETYTAGNGIDITNGVISVSYPDADSTSF